jgi:hypothetical protein
MNAEYAGDTAIHGFFHGSQGLPDDIQFIADQGRQHAGGAERAVRFCYGANAFDGRSVVEQHTAAAIDLRIDEARHKVGAGQVNDPCTGIRSAAGTLHRRDAAFPRDDRKIVPEAVPHQHLPIDVCGFAHSRFLSATTGLRLPCSGSAVCPVSQAHRRALAMR